MKISIVIAAIFASALFALPSAQAATRIDDPAKFVRGVYDGFVKDPNHYDEPTGYYYTPRLKALWANERHDAGDEEGRIDFDPWVDAQACDIKTPAVVTTEDVDSHKDRMVVIAQFTNIGKKENIHFYFERTAAGWLLDDMRSLRGTGWTLSTILKYGEDSDPDAKKRAGTSWRAASFPQVKRRDRPMPTAAKTDQDAPVPELGISTEKVDEIIVMARQFDAKEGDSDPDEGSNPTDDGEADVLEDKPQDDAVQQELVSFINGLDEEERANLIALAWVGRGTYDLPEWQDALDTARNEHKTRAAQYLLQLPLLGDYLANGLEAFGEEFSENAVD